MAIGPPILSDAWLQSFYDDDSATRQTRFAPDIAKHTEEVLTQALGAALPTSKVGKGYADPAQHLRSAYLGSIHRFGFDKTAAQVMELNTLAKDSKSFSEFAGKAADLGIAYNEHQLNAEYVTAQASAQNDANTLAAIAAGDQYWEWSAVVDDRTRPEHRALNGKVFSLADGAGSESLQAMPATDFACRCKARYHAEHPTDAHGNPKPLTTAADVIAATTNADTAKAHGFFQNRLQTKELMDSGLSYLQKLGDANQPAYTLNSLTFAQQGQRPHASLPFLNSAPHLSFFPTAEGEADQDWLGDTWHYYTGALRFEQTADILANPHEVYLTMVGDTYTYNYLRFYKDEAIAVTTQVSKTQPPTITNSRSMTASFIDKNRVGLLIHFNMDLHL